MSEPHEPASSPSDPKPSDGGAAPSPSASSDPSSAPPADPAQASGPSPAATSADATQGAGSPPRVVPHVGRDVTRPVVVYLSRGAAIYVPTFSQAQVARLLSYGMIGCTVITMCLDLLTIIASGSRRTTSGDPGALTCLCSSVILIYYVFYLVFNLRWLYLAHSNLASFGFPVANSPGWAVGSWFVPVVNLVVPYLILRELYHGSLPDARIQPNGGGILTNYREPTPDWFVCFWFTGVATLGLMLVSVFLHFLGAPAFGAALSITASLLSIVATLLWIKLIESVEERQTRHGLAFAAIAQTAPGAPGRP